MAGAIETANPGKGRYAAKSEVNVTPFVDVMLVLLIVFMVAAPIATVAVPLYLPTMEGERPPPPPPVMISLQDTGVINVGTESGGEVATDWSHCIAVVDQKTGGDRSRRIFVRADQKVPYGAVMRLMDLLHQRGYRDKTLITEDVVG